MKIEIKTRLFLPHNHKTIYKQTQIKCFWFLETSLFQNNEKFYSWHIVFINKSQKTDRIFDTAPFCLLSLCSWSKVFPCLISPEVIAFHKPFYTLFRTTVVKASLVYIGQRFFFEYYHLPTAEAASIALFYHLVLRNFLCCCLF